jgi:hypothetical protein
MQIALWITAGATIWLAAASTAIWFTWRDSRRQARVDAERERVQSLEERMMESARREFAAKDDLSGLQSNLVGLGVVALLISGLAVWDRLGGGKDRG